MSSHDNRHRRVDTERAVAAGNQSGSILVVDDEPAVVRALDHRLRPFRPIVGAGSMDEALAVLRGEERLCGAVIDVELADGADGFDVLERIRRQFPELPALVLIVKATPTALERAYDLDARLLVKGTAARHLARFGVHCILADVEDDAPVRDALATYAGRHHLSALDVEIVHGALHERRADWFVAERHVARSTYKSRVAALLDKTNEESLAAIVTTIFRSALRLSRERGTI